MKGRRQIPPSWGFPLKQVWGWILYVCSLISQEESQPPSPRASSLFSSDDQNEQEEERGH